MKTWEKPKLIVLARSEPEEAVLTTCKGGTHSGTVGSHNSSTLCYNSFPCPVCSTVHTS